MDTLQSYSLKNNLFCMKQQIIECVPNFSEGRDMAVIKAITDAI